MADSGGFDGAPEPVNDGGLEGAIAAAEVEEAPAPVEGEQPAPEPTDWRTSLDPETRTLVESKGWRDPAEMARSYREAEASMHRERQERERIESMVLAQQNAQPGQETGPSYSEADVHLALANGEITDNEARAYFSQLSDYRDQRIQSEIDKRLGQYDAERVQPLGQVQAAELLRGEISQVQSQVGQEELQRYGQQAIDIRKQMGISFPDAYALAKGRAETQRAVEARRSQFAETANGGARGRVPQKSDEEILAEQIFSNTGPSSGGFD